MAGGVEATAARGRRDASFGGGWLAIIARQFARPRGLFGHMVGRGMAKRNGEFSRWVVGEISEQHMGEVSRIVEIGPGPGVGLAEALTKFSKAHMWGVDISPEMLSL